jgi:hypothetical protein
VGLTADGTDQWAARGKLSTWPQKVGRKCLKLSCVRPVFHEAVADRFPLGSGTGPQLLGPSREGEDRLEAYLEHGWPLAGCAPAVLASASDMYFPALVVP